MISNRTDPKVTEVEAEEVAAVTTEDLEVAEAETTEAMIDLKPKEVTEEVVTGETRTEKSNTKMKMKVWATPKSSTTSNPRRVRRNPWH